MIVDEDVSLVVDGRRLLGFQEVNVTRSLEGAAVTFGLTATNPSWSAAAWALRLGARVELETGGALLLRGFVDRYESDATTSERAVRVSGRSLSGDLVDCQPVDHKTGRVEGKTLLEVAKEFAAPFRIPIVADIPLSALPKVQRHPTDTVFQTLERVARSIGALLVGEPDGGLRITRAGTKRHAGALVEGEPPIKSFRVSFSADKKFSEIVVRAQSASGTGPGRLRLETREYDSQVGRYRPLVIFHEGDATEREIKNRAQWERVRRAGSGTVVDVTVSTWRDAEGRLWEPGRLIAVRWPSERIDQDLTLSSVTFRQNAREGTIATLTLVDPRTLGGEKPRGSSDPAYGTRKFNPDGR